MAGPERAIVPRNVRPAEDDGFEEINRALAEGQRYAQANAGQMLQQGLMMDGAFLTQIGRLKRERDRMLEDRATLRSIFGIDDPIKLREENAVLREKVSPPLPCQPLTDSR